MCVCVCVCVCACLIVKATSRHHKECVLVGKEEDESLTLGSFSGTLIKALSSVSNIVYVRMCVGVCVCVQQAKIYLKWL